MVTTLCMSGSVLAKAGAKVADVISGCVVLGGDSSSYIVDEWINQAESFVNTACRYNFTDNYDNLNADVKKILEDAVSSLAAIYSIQYDMSGYTSRTEAETMLDVLRDRFTQALNLLKDKKAVDFINGA